MPGPDLPETPAPLKSVQPYLKTASEHDARDVVVSYWCRLYALQTGLKLSTKTGEETNFLLKLMDWLESTKKAHHENEAITNEVAAQAHLENWALKLFLYADKHDRASNFGKNVIQSFYTAGLLYDVLTTFGELSEEASQNKKYAKWKAAYIHNCLKNGQTPVPGPAKEDGDDNSNENVGSDLHPGVQPSQPTLPAMPMQPPMMPTRPTQPTPPTTMGAYDFPSVPVKHEDNKDNENNERDENNEGVENNEEPAESGENKDDENNENLDNDENNENDESIENNENVETNENDENNESNENDESHENNDNNEEAAENEENQDDGKDEKSEPHPYNPAPTPTNPGNNRVTYDDKSIGIKSETGVELTVELSGKAQKYIKWAGSSLNYDDVPTAILNLKKALHLLTTGEDPA
ncbi:vacuolar protein sorting-associated protein VTA1 homolog isoform X2 [Nasonia vitripennis]|uniref:Vacuolar protein n=1 Tax=Nasonia vitripennis TaxID=7425 RepID=A0A7M7TCF7_NASVI|nr:vacuolar protein sorting-associated protein VTA1 homolog isoform X2 [Nasonia vitripennis]